MSRTTVATIHLGALRHNLARIKQMAAPAKVFATERLTPPPREIYALHRKLSGAISTCTKLGVRIECRGVLQEMWEASELA